MSNEDEHSRPEGARGPDDVDDDVDGPDDVDRALLAELAAAGSPVHSGDEGWSDEWLDTSGGLFRDDAADRGLPPTADAESEPAPTPLTDVIDSELGDDSAVPDAADAERLAEVASDVDRVVLAVEVGDVVASVGLVTARGELVVRETFVLPSDLSPVSFDEQLAAAVSAVMSVASTKLDADVVAVGAATAAAVEAGLTAAPGLREVQGAARLHAVPLLERLRQLTDLPAAGDSEAKGLALAEGWLGAAQGHANFCAISLASLVDAGIVLDNELLDGDSGRAGQVGHVIVAPGGRRCRCGAQGCLDAEASALAIQSITGRPISEPSYEIMQLTGRAVGIAAADVCNALDLRLVVVGGPVALSFAATFFHSAQAALDEAARLSYSRGARITPSRLGVSGSLIGAGALGWRGVWRTTRRRAR